MCQTLSEWGAAYCASLGKDGPEYDLRIAYIRAETNSHKRSCPVCREVYKTIPVRTNYNALPWPELRKPRRQAVTA
jgi:hypothetical protein